MRIISNPSRFDSIVATGRMIDLLNQYQRETLSGRLRTAGLSPEMMNVIDIQQVNIGSAAGPAVILLTMIPPFLIFTLFTGGVHVALDSTCGERERGSFEPLMMNPVTRNQVLAGKLGATIVFTLMALGVQVVAFWVMLHIVPQETSASRPGRAPCGFFRRVGVPAARVSGDGDAITDLGGHPQHEGSADLSRAVAADPGSRRHGTGAGPGQRAAGARRDPDLWPDPLMGQLMRNETVSLAFIGITAVATLTATGLLLLLGFACTSGRSSCFRNTAPGRGARLAPGPAGGDRKQRQRDSGNTGTCVVSAMPRPSSSSRYPRRTRTSPIPPPAGEPRSRMSQAAATAPSIRS